MHSRVLIKKMFLPAEFEPESSYKITFHNTPFIYVSIIHMIDICAPGWVVRKFVFQQWDQGLNLTMVDLSLRWCLDNISLVDNPSMWLYWVVPENNMTQALWVKMSIWNYLETINSCTRTKTQEGESVFCCYGGKIL